MAAIQAEPQSQHLLLARMQLIQRRLQPLRQIRRLGRICARLRGRVVADQVTSREFAVFAHRRLERDTGMRAARPRLVDSVGIDVQVLTHFVNRWLAAELSPQLPLGTRSLGQ